MPEARPGSSSRFWCTPAPASYNDRMLRRHQVPPRCGSGSCKARSVKTLAQFVQAPLEGKLSVSRVFWLYGVVGSLAYGLLEFFINPANALLMRLYTVGAYAYSAYVIIGTYRCAVNCRTLGMARFVRISAILSLLLLPVFLYFELSGALDG